MKRILILCFSIILGTISFAQKETYDIVNYTAPKGWKTEVKNNLTSYSSTNSKNNTWCQIFIVKSGVSKGNIDDDFNSEWQDFAVKNYKPTDAPQVSETKEADGWKIKSGIGNFVFNNSNALVLVTTFSGYNRCVSVVAATNSTDYQKDIEDFLTSLDLVKQETGTQVQKTESAFFVGAWGKSNTVSQINNRFGNYSYNKQQYIFNADGTYRFLAKTYDEKDAETFLIKEKGNYMLKGNSITLTPTSSVIETWSKKNGGDNWNALKSSQKRPLEAATYKFSKVDNSLILQTDKQTQRDGKFNAGNTYSYDPPGTFTPIALPEGDTFIKEIINSNTGHNVSVSSISNKAKTNFSFFSTNFDDGWVGTEREEWVEVLKGDIKVLLHYPKEGTVFPADPGPMTTTAWNILVAPRYSNLRNFKTSYIATYDRPYLGMGYATEKETGKNVFIVFFHQGHEGWIEYVSPDKNSFIQQYNFDPETIQWDSNSDLMIPLAKMSGYNKFAVAVSDFKGVWTSDFTGIQQLYNVYTGQYAGMNINQSSQEFIFQEGNSYSWRLLAVNGVIGNVKAVEVKSTGQFSIPNNWQIKFTKIEGKPHTYHAFWSCIKGARVLNLLDADAPGSGIYTKFGLAKK